MTTPNEELLARAKRLRHELGDSNSRLDRQCVTAMYEMEQALQSQAERIKVIERESEMRRIALHDVMLESAQLRAQLRAQLAGMTANTATDKHLVDLANDTATRLLKERDTLRAEIAGTAAVEPVATLVVEWVFHEYDNSAKEDRVGYVSTSFHRTAAAEKMPIGKYALFTRPMPAQDVNAELVEALEMIVSTHQGHCEHHVGVSKHSYNLADIAEEALSKYKGAKL